MWGWLLTLQKRGYFSVGKYSGASVRERGAGVNIKLICRLKQHSFFNLDTLSNLKGITR